MLLSSSKGIIDIFFLSQMFSIVCMKVFKNVPIFFSTAGKPKKDDAMKSLCLMLGPDFITEILEVSSLFEPELVKTNKMTCAQQRIRLAWAST